MIECIQLDALQDNYNYILVQSESRQCVVIDPSEAEPILEYLKANSLQLVAILNTHHHWDHTDGNLDLQLMTGCRIFGNAHDKGRIPGITDLIQPGKAVLVNDDFKFESFECSGHTIGHLILYNLQLNALFCGDALFSLGCGRMFEGSPQQYYTALKQISTFSSETLIFCGHEYTKKNLEFCLRYKLVSSDDEAISTLQAKCENELRTIPSSVGFERKFNPFLRVLTASEKASLGLSETVSNIDTFAHLRTLRNSF